MEFSGDVLRPLQGRLSQGIAAAEQKSSDNQEEGGNHET
jgi:hypothetical protein